MIQGLKTITHTADVCIVGGGMTGMIGAIAAARHGAQVVLIHDRPVLGGNASSEVRMWIRGAAGIENREAGILQEIEMENIYRNPTMNYSLWDSVLWQKLIEEKRIVPLMNCPCMACDIADGRIKSVTGFQTTTYQFHKVQASLFMDCSGDSILGPLSGAAFTWGREGKEAYGESGAPDVQDKKTMGNTCIIQARETDHPCTYVPPPFAYTYKTDESMHNKNHDFIKTGVNFWWIELGGEEDTIADAEGIRDELIKTAYGVWDHIKNHGDHGAERFELEWIGFLPGKRESRRYIGDVMLTQQNLADNTTFPDTVAYGGWTMDNHAPEGFRYPGYSSVHITPHVPYQIPFRSLYSKNVENLLFAGRNISASHMAISSTRVMATCCLMGQAAGTAAALCVKYQLLPRQLCNEKMETLQSKLMDDLCYLPGLTRKLPALMANVQVHLPSEQAAILQNGWERPHGKASNCIPLKAGAEIKLVSSTPLTDASLRLVLDPDFLRESISTTRHAKLFAMRTHIFKNEPLLKMPANLAKTIRVRTTAKDGTVTETLLENNHQILLRMPLPNDTVEVSICFLTAWQGDTVHVFSCDINK